MNIEMGYTISYYTTMSPDYIPGSMEFLGTSADSQSMT